MIRHFIFLLVCCAAQASGAATALFEIHESPAIYLQTPLEHTLHRYSNDSHLGDLLVMDRDGALLPARIVVAPGEQQAAVGETLRFFTVPAGTEQNWFVKRNGETVLRLDDEALTLTLGDKGEAQQKSFFYIVDLREHKTLIARLSLDWPAEDGQYLPVEISGSNDLLSWTELARDTLLQLEKNDEELLRKEVAVHIAPERYAFLRIRFPGNESVSLTGLTAFEPQRENRQAAQRWEVPGQVADEQYSASARDSRGKAEPVAAWEFRRQEKAPARAVSLDLQEAAYGDLLRIYSRDSRQQNWRLLHSGIWFNVQLGKNWQRSDPVAIHPNTDRYWRIELAQAAAGAVDPRLVLEQPAQTLQFIANDNPPYCIAISANSDSGGLSPRVIASLVGDKEVQWQTVAAKAIPGLQPPAQAEQELNWSAWLFWTVLALSVVILTGFALRLYRQMNTES